MFYNYVERFLSFQFSMIQAHDQMFLGLTHLDTKSIVINLQLSKIRILDMMFTALDFHIQSA